MCEESTTVEIEHEHIMTNTKDASPGQVKVTSTQFCSSPTRDYIHGVRPPLNTAACPPRSQPPSPPPFLQKTKKCHILPPKNKQKLRLLPIRREESGREAPRVSRVKP